MLKRSQHPFQSAGTHLRVLETNLKVLKTNFKVLKIDFRVLEPNFKVPKLEKAKIRSVLFVSQVRYGPKIEIFSRPQNFSSEIARDRAEIPID